MNAAFQILNIDTVHPIFNQLLETKAVAITDGSKLSRAEVLQCIHQYDGIQIRSRMKVDKELLDKATNLKFIARAGAGMESIDTDYAISKGILCINSPEGNSDAVAEHALGMLLALFNKLLIADKQVRQGIWQREPNRGHELKGKTVGIIGYGNMGKAFTQRLQGFGVNILVYDKYLQGFGNDWIKESNMDNLFNHADVISLHLPLTPETRHLINTAFINTFKKPIYLINTARGQIVNTPDLVTMLSNGKVLGACLDVLEYEASSFQEIDIKEQPAAFQELIAMNNVILSPHIAGWSQESAIKIPEILAQKIINAFHL